MEIRQTEVVEVRADAREIVGIAVPYGQTTVIRSSAGSYNEQFIAGSIQENIEVPVYYRHDWRSNGLSVGYISQARSEESGYYVTAKIHRNAKGDQLLNDVVQGRVKNFSVGFTPIEDKQDGDIVVRTKVDLQEVSLVEQPAYIGATVAEYANK
ncbi:hypothetical protein GCM10007304_30260 [Rhodococcoides trifolii]|uniref:Prohead serine protease domain-containing protein n=1 Tax=Rhodococcoides trifolii TaxID=908250 RepID=A0A917FYE5_9NOCA|nr:HK97 family phage prohead protease [Rhodococcus trifolii]GGG14116.1 hypothetical protein GCM10007304_30260 [Rhodococcus trifolii]